MNKTKASRQLSFLLRHSTEPRYINLNGGWADVNTMVAVLAKKNPGFNAQILSEIVAEDEKGRYSYDPFGKRIRANQGHSIPGVYIEMASPVPPDTLFHGTATRFLESIMESGLLPMSRQYVHISGDPATASVVGRRHGTPVVLKIDAKRFLADGHRLLRSDNGVWQADYVPPEYLTVMEDSHDL